MSFSNLNLEDIHMLIAANAASAAAQLQQKQSLHTSRSSISGWTPTSAKNSLSNGVSGMSSGGALDPQSQSKYHQLLSVIEEMSKDIRPTYAGSKSSAERLKRGIIFARILVRECLVETERSART
ncbi:uncharacterized protein [Lepeophtheirus salmonis]|uniref:Cyclin-dependent kinase 2-associated protein 2 n=1 Tax=Lepeophtheirus salmonis TaxID=72036 RepID=C1BVD9_LEPSM|nr:cyclin-dependent kinase 2-associated protein 1-like [Lepeophtheirus salmonis]ACO12992.1 Cyclin-dependent kinase 2-associated protein 2 [Lepeophtheirus salmonis]